MSATAHVDPFILSSWVKVSEERGLSLEEVADQVEPESALLAEALREVAGKSKAEVRKSPKARERAVKRG